MNTLVRTVNAHNRELKFAVRESREQADFDVITEVFVNDCYRLNLLKAHGFRPKVILDVGGHIGSFGTWAKTLWPEAMLIALEPFEENFNMYQQNLQLNGITNSNVLKAAINYDPNRPVFQNVTSGATGGGCFIPVSEAEKKAGDARFTLDTSIKCITLEDIVQQFNLSQIDLAKFDCEGGEREAFRKMQLETLAKFKYIVGEFHSMGVMGQNFREIYMSRFVNHDITIPECDLPRDCGFFFAYPKVK